MSSKKDYSFDPRDSSGYRYFSSTRDSGRPTYTSNMFSTPKENKIDRENFLTKEDSKRVSENVTKSVITRSVVDRRSSSSYRTREDSKSGKTRDLQGISDTEPSRFSSSVSHDANENEIKAPISSFYSSYTEDEDRNKESGISSFYQSSIGSGRDGKNADHITKTSKENTDSRRASSHGASFSGVHATGGESWRSSDKRDSSGSLGRERSLERNVRKKDTATASERETDGSRKITLDDVHILRRALERKQASNSLERERLSKKLSEDDPSNPSEPTLKAYLSYSEKDSTADQIPKTRSSVRTTYDLGYRGNKRTGSGDVADQLKKFEVAAERLGRQTRSTYSVEFPAKLSTRSRSSEHLDDKKRSRQGIYRELPGRKELLSYSRSLSNAATSRSEDKDSLRVDSRSGSLDRHGGSMDYNSREDPDSRASLLRLRSRSSEELRSLDKENEMYPSHRSRYLSRQGNFERGDTFGRDVSNTRAIRRPSSHDKLREDIAKLKAETESRVTKKGDVKLYSFSREPSITRETKPSSHVKLREDIAKLKAEAESRKAKKDDVKLYSFSREPSIQDKLKEDIAKLKAETLTRDHGKPYIPPYSSRTEPEEVASRWRRREPSIQDKLKEDIAKLKAETRNFPRKAPATTEIIIPDRSMDERGNVRQSGLARTTIQRYHLSEKDGDVFKDELNSEETRRYGKKDKDHGENFTTRANGALRIEDKPVTCDELTYADRNIRDEVFPESSRDPSRPARDQGASFPRRPSEEAPPTFFSRARDDGSSSWPRTDEGRLLERNDSLTFPRKVWDDPKRTSWERRAESTQGYASKKVFRADSTVSISSTRDTQGVPSSVRGFFHGSVSEEDQSAYFSRQKGDKEDGYPQSTRTPETFRRPDEAVRDPFRRSAEATPQPVRQPDEAMQEFARRQDGAILEPGKKPDDAIPLPYTGYEIVTPKCEEPNASTRGSRDEPKPIDKGKREVHSERVHSSREFVTSKTIRDSDTPRELVQESVSRQPIRGETSRHFSGRSEPSTRRTSIREEVVASEEIRIPYPKEVIAPIPEYKDSGPSRMSELRKKVEQLKSKVDSLDDSRSRMQLEKYVDEHSEKKPDVEIKDPVNIKRYQLSERRSERSSVVDDGDPLLKRSSIDVTSESMSRQISRQTSQTSTRRRISSIREEDLRPTAQNPVTGESPDEVFPKERKPHEKPTVMKQVNDAATMTAPDVQEQVGGDMIRRQDSTVREIVDGPVRLQELRGVPIQQIEEVGTGQRRESGITTINIDNQQHTLTPKKDVQGWWNAFTAEDVDRLLELGNWGPWNAYTAEDVDRMFQLGPVRRRSLRRGSYERRSLKRYPRRSRDDHVDVHVRVRGRQETRSRPQCIIAQAAPEEKAIVLRDTKESADPFIRKIKVDDIYGADAVRVENGVVKIKVGDLTSRGKRAWARILQQKNRIVESDGTVTIPVNQDHYEDGVYYTNYYQGQGQEQDGTVRIPITVKIQEQNKAKAKKPRVVREMKKSGSMRRRRRTAGSRGYIVGARYYSGNLMLKSTDGHRSQGNQKEIVLRQRQEGSKIAKNEIVLRRSSQSTAFPMQTVQRIHEGHRTTSQAASVREEGGKMVITVHAVPPQEPRFNLKQVGENVRRTSEMLTSGAYHGGSSDHRGVSNTSGNYYISPTSGGGGITGAHTPRGYITTSTSGRQGGQGTSYFVTDPSDSLDRRSGKSGYQGVTRVYTSNEMSSTPTIVPYEDKVHPSRRGTQMNDSFISDPSSIYGFYDAPGTRIIVTDPRLNARTGYGEKFNLRDHGGISSVHYVNGARQGARIINEKMSSNGRYRYGSSWNSKQQDTLNGRSMAWAVEEVRPDF